MCYILLAKYEASLKIWKSRSNTGIFKLLALLSAKNPQWQLWNWNAESKVESKYSKTTAAFRLIWSSQSTDLTLNKFYWPQKNRLWLILLAFVSISGINLEQIFGLSFLFLIFFQGCAVWIKIEMLFWEHSQTLLWRVCQRQMCFQWSSSSLWMVRLRFFSAVFTSTLPICIQFYLLTPCQVILFRFFFCFARFSLVQL